MIQALTTLVGVIVTAFVTWSIAQRRIAVENVTKERAKWREQIRDLASQIHEATSSPIKDKMQIQKLKTRLTVLLDPCDNRDKQILGFLDNITEKSKKAFTTEVTLMLKHDWERSKLEAGFFLCRWFFCIRRLEQSDVEKGNVRWCRKYEIKGVPLLILVFMILIVIFLIDNCKIYFDFCSYFYWLNSTCWCN